MRVAEFVCILGHMLLIQDVCGTICEQIELLEGEIFVTGDEVIFDGITEVDGNVPMNGNVVFEGPVRATGTVTILGSTGPMLSAFGLGPSIRPPMMLPNCYVPYSLFSNPCPVVPDIAEDLTLGYGNMAAHAGDISVAGEASLEGTVPIAGNVCFDGGVPAYGKVTIIARF